MEQATIGVSGPGFVSILVRDVEASAAFYEQQVGLVRDPQPFPRAVAFLTRPIPFAVMALPPDTPLDQESQRIAVWFKAADAQATYEAMVAGGVVIARAPFDGPFGRTFAFLDPDGYRITVYEHDAPDVSRMARPQPSS